MFNYIQLNRKFSPVTSNLEENVSTTDYSLHVSSSQKFNWDHLLNEYRCVILAEAGAGKTKEFEQCAQDLLAKDKFSFFIRIEDIDSHFFESFEVGDEDLFFEWLNSREEAWFFLDSVDEARLENPKQFQKAIKKFAKIIRPAALRAHIYISSRPYSWRYKEDEDLLNSELYYLLPQSKDSDNKPSKEKSALKIFSLSALDIDDIKAFCEHRSVLNITDLLDQIVKHDLLGLAERPFDLDSIISKWHFEGTLGSRFEIIDHNIKQRLRDAHVSDRLVSNVSFERLYEGAQRLAAAVILTTKVNINVPSSIQNPENLEAYIILPEWNESEILTLLNSAIFNDIVYGAVRFRHRDIKEFLASKWFLKLLNGDNRFAIERLFFREHFGEQIITPSLRCILPWLILEDEIICQRVIITQPEIAFESGDPFKLSLDTRKNLLKKFVARIALNLDDRSIRHNESIARISNKDLEEEVLSLIQAHTDNDDVIFFLARMAWYGKLIKCVPALLDIASDVQREMSTRRVCSQVVMICGTKVEITQLWTAINSGEEVLDRKLIAELVEDISQPDEETIDLILFSLQKVAPYEQFEYTGLRPALKKIVQNCNEDLAFKLLHGLSHLLFEEPFNTIENYIISQKNAWILKIAFLIIQKFTEQKSRYALEEKTLSILMHSAAITYQDKYDLQEEKLKLEEIIPQWYELNDTLYFYTLKHAKKYHLEKKNEYLNDDWSYCYLDHFWQFDASSFERFLNFIKDKEDINDKLIIINRAYLIYCRSGKPSWMLRKIKLNCKTEPILVNRLNILLKPVISEAQKKHEKTRKKQQLEQEKQRLEQAKNRSKWIEVLCENPSILTNSVHFLEGDLTKNHVWLMNELSRGRVSSKREEYANWKYFIPDFGKSVALAYREAAIKFWKIYKPCLHSEESLAKNSTPYAVIFGLAGLDIIAKEVNEFPNHLDAKEREQALRYINWELNGFPLWLEKFHKAFPNEVVKAIMKEVKWELQQSDSNKQNYNHILHDLFYHAPWINTFIAPEIYHWLSNNPKTLHEDTRKYALQILLNSDIKQDQFSLLAQSKINDSQSVKDKAWWFALYVDSSPEEGITELQEWLELLNKEDATYAAQVFICHLVGTRNSINGKAGRDEYKQIKYLRRLYSLMQKHIIYEEDIHRAGMGVYSPELRDHAQDARDLLFKYLQEIPCSESYYALKELAIEQRNNDRKIWLQKLASKIAQVCGDIEPYSVESLLQLEQSGYISPTTHRMLFDLALMRIGELKDNLENGDASPARTWRRVPDETEMRNLISNELRKVSFNKYSLSQEDELANSQRTDIKFHNPRVSTPVPIELKILDKSWSGPALCERLRNQLVGDYLRESNASCGIFLLVSKECKKKWKINGKITNLENLASALEEYWQSIAKDWPGVDSIKVVVIDLYKRALVSDT